MKKFGVKKRQEKLLLAVIILSCGFVLQADPPARQHQKGPQMAYVAQGTDHVRDYHSARPAKASRQHQHLTSR